MNYKIRWLLTIDGFRIFAFGLLGPIYAVFVKKIGGDILDVGLAFAIFSIVLGCLAYLVGKIGDRLVKYRFTLLELGYLILSLGFFSYLFVKTPLHFMISQVVLGIGGALAAPIFDAIFSSNLDRHKYSSEWAGWEAENFILTGIAAIAGASIAKFLGFKILFFLMGCSMLLSLINIYLLKRKIKKNSAKLTWLTNKLFRKD